MVYITWKIGKKRDKEERDRLILERASEEKWIIEGSCLL